MKTVGLITEYNPFHKGHEFHILESLRITGADRAIIVMSGDFVQRGTPAIMPKHLRTEMALKGGASMVIELPVRYATASAEIFATSAIELLESLACVDAICFGSECGDITALSKVADVLVDEPIEYQKILQASLRQGISYPKAREIALMKYSANVPIDGNILKDPNNILGVEYLKALKKIGSSMTPYTITRNTSKYHDVKLGTINSSASAIRKVLLSNMLCIQQVDNTLSYQECKKSTDVNYLELLTPHLTADTIEIIKSSYSVRFPLDANDFSLLLWNKLLHSTFEDLYSYADITEELARRIYNLRHEYQSFTQFTKLIKTKNYTYSRISRCLLHILLDINVINISPPNEAYEINQPATYIKQTSDNEVIYNHYIHVLGFKKEDKDLLTLISNESKLPLLTKLKNIDTLSPIGSKMARQDMAASDLYEMILAHKFRTPYIPELSKSMIMI